MRVLRARFDPLRRRFSSSRKRWLFAAPPGWLGLARTLAKRGFDGRLWSGAPKLQALQPRKEAGIVAGVRLARRSHGKPGMCRALCRWVLARVATFVVEPSAGRRTAESPQRWCRATALIRGAFEWFVPDRFRPSTRPRPPARSGRATDRSAPTVEARELQDGRCCLPISERRVGGSWSVGRRAVGATSVSPCCRAARPVAARPC